MGRAKRSEGASGKKEYGKQMKIVAVQFVWRCISLFHYDHECAVAGGCLLVTGWAALSLDWLNCISPLNASFAGKALGAASPRCSQMSYLTSTYTN